MVKFLAIFLKNPLINTKNGRYSQSENFSIKYVRISYENNMTNKKYIPQLFDHWNRGKKL